jgi:hypothetical protein
VLPDVPGARLRPSRRIAVPEARIGRAPTVSSRRTYVSTAPDILAAMVKASKRLLNVGLVVVVLLALTVGYLFSYEEVRVGGTSPLEDEDTARQATAYVDAGWEVARSQYTPQLAYWLHRARWVGWVERLREVF